MLFKQFSVSYMKELICLKGEILSYPRTVPFLLRDFKNYQLILLLLMCGFVENRTIIAQTTGCNLVNFFRLLKVKIHGEYHFYTLKSVFRQVERSSQKHDARLTYSDPATRSTHAGSGQGSHLSTLLFSNYKH